MSVTGNLAKSPGLWILQTLGLILLLLFYEIDILSNCFLYLYLSTHRLVKFSNLIQALPLCSS